MAKNDEKNKALEEALGQITKKFGKGAIMKLGDTNVLDVETVSTGSIQVDSALGIGGLPFGRIVEIYGPESSGKTTLTLHVIAEAQKIGKTCAFIDAEHALDPVYARKLGVNINDLLVSQPDNGEQALEICDTLVSSGVVDVVVIDSVAALTPKAEIEGDMGDSHMGLQARLMSQGLRKITGNVKHNNTLVIFINQLRHKIGVMFSSPETTTGGNALKFYASMRLDIRRTGSEKDSKGEIYANNVKVKVVKNKLSPPFREVHTMIKYGSGFDKTSEIIDLAVEHGFLKKAGAWYSKDGNNIGQGKEKTIIYLNENPNVLKELETKVKDKITQSYKWNDNIDAQIEEEYNDENDYVEE